VSGRRRALVVGVALGLVGVLAPAVPIGAQRPGSYCATVDAPDDAFVDSLYDLGMERCPSQTELDYWVGRLAAGQTRLTVVEALLRSDEPLDDVLGTVYGKSLGREPTADERMQGFAVLRARRDDVPLDAAVKASEEYLANQEYPTDPEARDRQWVADRFPEILDREAGEPSVDYYVASFGPGGSTAASRARVDVTLAHSAEGRRVTVARSYSRHLRRDPGPAEVAFWAGWLRGVGRDRALLLASSLVASAEGYQRTQPPEGF